MRKGLSLVDSPILGVDKAVCLAEPATPDDDVVGPSVADEEVDPEDSSCDLNLCVHVLIYLSRMGVVVSSRPEHCMLIRRDADSIEVRDSASVNHSRDIRS